MTRSGGGGGGGGGRVETQPLLGLSLHLLLLSLLPFPLLFPRYKLITSLHRLPRMWRHLLSIREAPELVPPNWGMVLIGLNEGQEGAVLPWGITLSCCHL